MDRAPTDARLAVAGYPVRRLFELSQAEADRLFDALPDVPLATLDGCFRGRLLAVSGFGWLPRFLRRPFYALLATPLNPWRGKSLRAGRGANLWFVCTERFPFARYRVATDPASGHEYLNYEVAENWSMLQRIRGEARQLDARTVLARMNYRLGDRLYRVLYFTLAKD